MLYKDQNKKAQQQAGSPRLQDAKKSYGLLWIIAEIFRHLSGQVKLHCQNLVSNTATGV